MLADLVQRQRSLPGGGLCPVYYEAALFAKNNHLRYVEGHFSLKKLNHQILKRYLQVGIHKLYLTGLKVDARQWGALVKFPNSKLWNACSPAPCWRIWVIGANGNWYLNHLMALLKNSSKGTPVGVNLCLVCPYLFSFHCWLQNTHRNEHLKIFPSILCEIAMQIFIYIY